MKLFILLRDKPELCKHNMLIKELEDMFLSRDKNNDLNKKMPRNFKNFWQRVFRGRYSNDSRLALSTWGY